MKKRMVLFLFFSMLLNNFAVLGLNAETVQRQVQQTVSAQGSVIGIMTACSLPLKIMSEFMQDKSCPSKETKKSQKQNENDRNASVDFTLKAEDRAFSSFNKMYKGLEGSLSVFVHEKEALLFLNHRAKEAIPIQEHGSSPSGYIILFIVVLAMSNLPYAIRKVSFAVL